MEIFKAFVCDETRHDVRIQWDGENPLFRASDIGKILGIVNIRHTSLGLEPDEKVIIHVDSPSGMQDVIFLTQDGLYSLLLKSRKPIAKPFQKWVKKVIRDIAKNGQYVLPKENTVSHETVDALLKKQKQTFDEGLLMATHDAFVKKFDKTNLVYFGRVKKLENGKMVIKIGNSIDLTTRQNALRNAFGEFIILDVFPCYDFIRFENHLHTHPEIECLRYNKHINGTISTEVFEFSQDDYKHAINIASKTVGSFNKLTPDQLFKLKHEELKNEQINLQIQQQLIVDDKGIPVPEAVVIDIHQPIIIDSYVERKVSTGHKIQKYTPSLELVETYTGISDASRKCQGATLAAIKVAAKNKTLYRHFRWHLLPRHEPDDKVVDIGPTVEGRQIYHGYIALLNNDKTRIDYVFPDQKTTAAFCKLKSNGAISSAIKKGTRSAGYFVQFWDNVEKELKDEFLSRSTLPNPAKRATGLSINQIHPITKTVIKTFESVAHILRDFPMSRQSLFAAIKRKSPIRNYYWAFAEDNAKDEGPTELARGRLEEHL